MTTRAEHRRTPRRPVFAGGNTVSPRPHFYDDGAGTGRVYVGYIGPHLTNTTT